MTRRSVVALALAALPGAPRLAAAGGLPTTAPTTTTTAPTTTTTAPTTAAPTTTAPTSPRAPSAPPSPGAAVTAPAPQAAAATLKAAILDAKAAARTQANADPAQASAIAARWDRELRRRIGRKPSPIINVFNTWTHEYLVVDAGHGATVPIEVVNHFLRCHFTNREAAMDTRLFGVLLAAASHFKSARIDIVSGFRAPKYNLMLRKKGHRVARDSQHTVGHAVDFRVDGVTTEQLRNWARRLRLGGVGYYQNDQFVHVDVGPIRYWKE